MLTYRDDDVDHLAMLVRTRTGLSLEGYRRNDLLRVLPSLEERHGGVASICRAVIAGDAQVLDDIVRSVTVGETTFFRYADQFRALEQVLLPELIAQRRADGTHRLTIWSAGCATGEEPYSIAVLLARLLPDIDDWSITLLGTDINRDFLAAAREAAYGAWSFRDTPPWLPNWFRSDGRRLRLREDARRLVIFDVLNLVADDYPRDVDLLFCRNVVIYFDAETQQHVVAKLRDALGPNGTLIVGHADLCIATDSGLEPHLGEGLSMFRVRKPEASARSADPECGGLAAAPVSPKPKRQQAAALRIPEDTARTFFDRAVVAIDRNEDEAAAEALRRSLYLDPRQPAAHYLAGVLAARRGNPRAAERHFRAARVTLSVLDDAAIVDGTDGLTAGRLRQSVDELLAGSEVIFA